MSELAVDINQEMVDSGSFQRLLDRALIDEPRTAVNDNFAPRFRLSRPNQSAARELPFGWVSQLQDDHIVPLGGEFQCIETGRFMQVAQHNQQCTIC
jgi:hypothetical protein